MHSFERIKNPHIYRVRDQRGQKGTTRESYRGNDIIPVEFSNSCVVRPPMETSIGSTAQTFGCGPTQSLCFCRPMSQLHPCHRCHYPLAIDASGLFDKPFHQSFCWSKTPPHVVRTTKVYSHFTLHRHHPALRLQSIVLTFTIR